MFVHLKTNPLQKEAGTRGVTLVTVLHQVRVYVVCCKCDFHRQGSVVARVKRSLDVGSDDVLER